ncbi:MAG: hypothetical protein K8R76_04745 [Candidatus Aegiribacteria sp.]|nr:hypothetical protein [Candidatus Aegiribacteria sp.]
MSATHIHGFEKLFDSLVFKMLLEEDMIAGELEQTMNHLMEPKPIRLLLSCRWLTLFDRASISVAA